MNVDLSIIIVNYKTPDLTIRCIESIYNSTTNFSYEIVVVDNCSLDKSRQRITEKFPSVFFVSNTENEGFGRANNLGVTKANGNYLLFLNSDMLLQTNTIEDSLGYIYQIPNIGVLGCKLLNEDGTQQKSVYHYVGDYMGVLHTNLLVDYFFKPKLSKIKAVMGAFMIIPKSIFNEVGGFDPDFFMYAEELDLCRRIENKKFEIKYLETVVAIHKHGGSTTNSDWAIKQNYLSSALLFLKVRGIFGYLLYHFLFVNSFLSNTLLLWKMDKRYRKDFWYVHKKYFSNIVDYIKIPFLYSKKIGNGQRILRRK